MTTKPLFTATIDALCVTDDSATPLAEESLFAREQGHRLYLANLTLLLAFIDLISREGRKMRGSEPHEEDVECSYRLAIRPCHLFNRFAWTRLDNYTL